MKILYKIALLFAFGLLSVDFVSAQTEREQGIALYKQGDYKGAVRLLKQASKTDDADAQAWYFLGHAYLKQDKTGEAEKAFKRGAALDGQNSRMQSGLAYVYLLKNKSADARRGAEAALNINPNDAEAHYVLGVASFRDGLYAAAYERARKAIELDENFAAAYLLKSESLVGSFAAQTGTVIKTPSAKGEMLREASADLEKYLTLAPGGNEADFRREYLESIRFFAEYYNRPENQKPVNFDHAVQAPDNQTPIKIISRPYASYTERARSTGVGGTIRVLVGFSTDGMVKHVLVVKPLGFGLDEQAVKAARGIKFEPATKDGKPVSIVKIVEYSFSIY